MFQRQLCSTEELKPCLRCKVEKALREFYEKEKDANGTILRRDAVCKDCRRSERLSRYKLHSTELARPDVTCKPEKTQKNRPERIIEPKIRETSELVNAIDFSDLEASCGKELQLAEKHDAVQRFNEFVSLLRGEYGRMVGGYVYIRKD